LAVVEGGAKEIVVGSGVSLKIENASSDIVVGWGQASEVTVAGSASATGINLIMKGSSLTVGPDDFVPNLRGIELDMEVTGRGSLYGLEIDIDRIAAADEFTNSYTMRGIDVSIGQSTRGTVYGGDFNSRTGENSTSYAVYGVANSGVNGNSYGVYGRAFAGTGGRTYGVYGTASGGATNNRYAGYFAGNVHVTGTLTKGSVSFLIDHPLDPENKTLRHNAVESPENLCLYRGKAKMGTRGSVTVKLPAYFTALTKANEATVQVTPIGSKPFLTSYEWSAKHDAIKLYGTAGQEVAYTVLADRDDPAIHHISKPVEESKSPEGFEKGKYLYPEAFKKAKEKGQDFNLDQVKAVELKSMKKISTKAKAFEKMKINKGTIVSKIKKRK